jgi:hypothetical protein
MTSIREPLLKPVAVSELRPTQMTVGMREVEDRRKRLRAHRKKEGERFFERHMIPVVLGPKQRHYVVDHHHLARAFEDEGIEDIFTTVLADLSKLDQDAFWIVLDNRGWMHPFDSNGRRCSYDEIPQAIAQLADDPFRSLAGALRRVGGFAKDTTPFSEFLWADFLRRRMKRAGVKRDFDEALAAALRLAKSRDADYLPGWCGPVEGV